MALGFDVTSWYGVVLALALAYVFWTSAFETGHRHIRAIKELVRPTPPQAPVIVLGHPGYSYNTVPLMERRLEKRALLTRLDPYYMIENKEATITVTDVTTGVRREKMAASTSSRTSRPQRSPLARLRRSETSRSLTISSRG
jgi:hypothetical protein